MCSFSIIGQKIKKLQLFYFFLPENLQNYSSTELYNVPLEGSTIFLYRSSTSRTPLDSSGLAELKYAFLSRIRAFKSAENVQQTYMVTVVWATRGIDNLLDTATQAVHRWIALD